MNNSTIKKLNILVVEDNELEGNSAKAQLKTHNVTVVKDFESFQKVWGSFHDTKGWGTGWDIVLADLNFPVDTDSDFKSDSGLLANQTQPVGAIVVLMAQAAKVPVKMLSKHGDTVNYPLEAMNIAVSGESGVDGRILVDLTSLETVPVIVEYELLCHQLAAESKRIMGENRKNPQKAMELIDALEESDAGKRLKVLETADPGHVYNNKTYTWTNTVSVKNWGGALQLLLSNK